MTHTGRVREVEVTDQFIEWWSMLSDAQREAVPDRAILLLGGDKSGEWNDWYERAIPLADDL